MEINLEKLELLFRERYESLKQTQKDEDFWVDYCDEHNIVLMHPQWVRETFNDGHENMVCIFSPEDDYDAGNLWLLVPRELAGKSLALGGLP